jgi:glutaredoxin
VIQVDVYTKRECCLCDEAKATLLRVQRDLPFALHEIDIESTPALYERYKERIPLVAVNGHIAFKFRVDETALRRRLTRVMEEPQR